MRSTKLNDGHIAELQDRLQVTVDYIDMVLAKHPLIEEISEFRNQIDEAMSKLTVLYQAVGQYDSIRAIQVASNWQLIHYKTLSTFG